MSLRSRPKLIFGARLIWRKDVLIKLGRAFCNDLDSDVLVVVYSELGYSTHTSLIPYVAVVSKFCKNLVFGEFSLPHRHLFSLQFYPNSEFRHCTTHSTILSHFRFQYSIFFSILSLAFLVTSHRCTILQFYDFNSLITISKHLLHFHICMTSFSGHSDSRSTRRILKRYHKNTVEIFNSHLVFYTAFLKTRGTHSLKEVFSHIKIHWKIGKIEENFSSLRENCFKKIKKIKCYEWKLAETL